MMGHSTYGQCALTLKLPFEHLLLLLPIVSDFSTSHLSQVGYMYISECNIYCIYRWR